MGEVGMTMGSHWSVKREVMSIVEDNGVNRSTCGYCKGSTPTSVAQELWAHTITVYDYQELLNRGWSRSGRFLYKPKMERTCCPPYTIRLNASDFVPSKEQSRVMRRMQRYLEGSYPGPQVVDDVKKSGPGATSDTSYEVVCGEKLQDKQVPANGSLKLSSNLQSNAKRKKPPESEDETVVQLKVKICAVIGKLVSSDILPHGLDIPPVMVWKLTKRSQGKLKNLGRQVEYTCNVAFAVAAAVKRLQSKANVEPNIGSDSEVNRLQPVSSKQDFSPVHVAEILVLELQETDVQGLIAEACNGHLNFLTVACTAEDNVSLVTPTVPVASNCNSGEEKKQASQGNGDQERRGKCASATTPCVKSRVKIQLKRSAFDSEEFALYKKYQIAVHNDSVVKVNSYRRFLVDSPLVYVPPETDGSTPVCGFGSFHQQYRVDGKLVAVGVVDILPNCLSSNYLFWDPDFAFLSLGKYTALREIQWVQEANKVCPALAYYYLGFYIHSCPKMRYKASYSPSELLCPVNYSWVPYDLAWPALDRSQYTCLADCVKERAATDQNSVEKDKEAEHEKKPSSIDDGDDGDGEMSSEGLEAKDVDCLALEGQEQCKEIAELTYEPQDLEILEEKNDLSTTLGQVIMLLNNRCMSFECLDLGVVPQQHMDILTEQLSTYVQGVGPLLASRMAFALT